MTRFAPGRAFLALALAVALAVPVASQQPRPATPQFDSHVAIVFFGSNKPLHEELKLSDEQVKQLQQHVAAWIEAFGKIKPADLASKAKELNDLNAKGLKDALKPEQLERLHQILRQEAVKGHTAERVVRYPDLVAVLKITDEQSGKLRSGETIEKVLSGDQQKQWQALLGKPFAGELRQTINATLRNLGRGGLGGRFGGLAVPTLLAYVLQKPVQDELKVKEEQLAKFKALQEKWDKFNEEYAELAPADRLAHATDARNDLQQAVKALLDEGQWKRLQQISIQQSAPTITPRGLLATVLVQQALTLDDATKEKLAAILKERAEGLEKIFLSGETAEKIADKRKAHHEETDKLVLALLTEAQRGKMKEIVGETFTGEITPFFRPGGFGGGRPFTPPSAPLAMFGVRYLAMKSVRDELKVADDQIKKLDELATWQREQMAPLQALGPFSEEYNKKYTEVGKAFHEKVSAILKPAQLERFQQITLQQMFGDGTNPGGFNRLLLPRMTDVADKLKLTEEQKTQLQGRDEVAKVLTADQQATWKKMLGEPFKGEIDQPFGPGGDDPRGGRGGPTPPALRYLTAKAVIDELRLTEAQRKDITALGEEYAKATGRSAQTTREERTKQLAGARAAFTAGIQKILKDTQAERFQQIQLQQLQADNGVELVLMSPDVIKALGIDAKQQAALEALFADANKVRDLIAEESGRRGQFGGGGGGLGGGGGGFGRLPRALRGGADTLATRFDEHIDKKMLASLTAEQQVALKKLLGEPFKGDLDDGLGGFGGRTRTLPVGFAPPASPRVGRG